jgi:Ca-activated chloride channel family protein
MDEQKLKTIMHGMKTPPVNENAKKVALNLALAEFQAAQKESENKSQGSSLWSRLTGKTDTNTRRHTMEQRTKKQLVFGGMATAMAVILIAGVSVTQLQNFGTSGAGADIAELAASDSELKKDLSATETATHNTAEIDAVQQAQSADQSHLFAAMPAPVRQEESQEMAAVSEMADMAAPSAPVASSSAAKAMRSSESVAGMAAPGYDGRIYIAPPTGEIMPYPHIEQGRDQFQKFEINPIKQVASEPVSTFSVDVDTASYSFVRRSINMGSLPPADAVRVEEMVNYFDYNYALPETREQPFKPSVTLVPSPWNEGKKLMHIGIKGFDIETAEQPRSNIVFLLDVSGSMNAPDKLPLVKSSMKMLLEKLKPTDTVAITVYAGAAGTVLEPTPASEKAKIITALDNLEAGGGTAGAAGIQLAYQLAQQNFVKDGVNRVILATDGDFNVGVSSPEELKKLAEEKRKSGIFLSILGFGQGNLNDELMQSIAQNGNGTAAYIDTVNEARKVLVEEATSTLFPIAKDVKIQIEFNPAAVAEYRLVGYETRALNREDFNNDKIDAGDIGAGHTVTAIYEITPVGSTAALSVDPLRYGAAEKPAADAATSESATAQTDFGGELAFLKIRYKLPNEDTSKLITTPVTTALETTWQNASEDVRFASAVASFGQLLKASPQIGNITYDDVITMADSAKGQDNFGYRAEFINLVRNAKVFSQGGQGGNSYNGRAE